MSKTILTLGMAATIALAGRAMAQQPKPAPPGAAQAPERAADRKALRSLVDAFDAAYDKGDAKAIAALFAEDAELVDEQGQRLVGRSAIGDHFAAGFAASPGGKIDIAVESLRFLGPEAAIEEGRTRVMPAQGEAPEASRYVVAYVKQNGKWLQSSVREYPDRQVSHHDRLKELEWLIGEWVDESSDSLVFTTCHWSDDKNYILRTFTIQIQGKPLMSGTQRIGWDAHARQFKSWVFDTEGGYGEGYWAREGNRWLVKSTGVMPDGRRATATNVFTIVSKDVVRWKSIDRTVGGQVLPDIPDYVMVRKPPKPR